MEHLDETRHVRTFETMREFDVHIKLRDRVLFTLTAILDPYRVADFLNTHLLNRDVAQVRAALDVGDVVPLWLCTQLQQCHGASLSRFRFWLVA